MSIWTLLLDHDYRQQADIDELQRCAVDHRRRLHHVTTDATARILALEEELGGMALLCRSLLTLLKETGHVDPQKLAGVMQRVDLEDGVADGRVTPARHRPPGTANDSRPSSGPS